MLTIVVRYMQHGRVPKTLQMEVRATDPQNAMERVLKDAPAFITDNLIGCSAWERQGGKLVQVAEYA